MTRTERSDYRNDRRADISDRLEAESKAPVATTLLALLYALRNRALEERRASAVAQFDKLCGELESLLCSRCELDEAGPVLRAAAVASGSIS